MVVAFDSQAEGQDRSRVHFQLREYDRDKTFNTTADGADETTSDPKKMEPWTGAGPILTGTCSTAAWTLFDLSTAYLWAPVIGCIEDKPNCCPSSFVFPSTTRAPSPTPLSTSVSIQDSLSTSSTSVSSDPSVIQPPQGFFVSSTSSDGGPNSMSATSTGDGAFQTLPTELQAGRATKRDMAIRDAAGGHNGVSRCPDDYVSIGSTGCCPYGMNATQTPGLIAACASVLATPFPAPELQTTGRSSAKPISTATNVLYAIQYRLYNLEYQPPQDGSRTGLSTGAKAGIGAGCGAVALAMLGAAVFLLRRRRRKHKQQQGISTVVPVTDEKPTSDPPVGGRAELVAEDVKQRYELSNTQVLGMRSTSPLEVNNGTQPHELSAAPGAFQAFPGQKHVVIPQTTTAETDQTQLPPNQHFIMDGMALQEQVHYAQQPVAFSTHQPTHH